MRIIIAGGRDFSNYKLLEKECNRILSELAHDGHFSLWVEESMDGLLIISGNANGADKLGERFAREYNLPVKRFPANWDLHGKSAGYRRNEQMAVYAKEDNGVLIACWDGKSRGTKHMIDLANKHGLRVFVVNY